jgi:sugar-specific transcriptional regulator TrmB
MEDLQEVLGLDDKESKIFVALCKLSKGSVNDIMKQTKIERRTIYDVLERLIQKGYARYIIENRRRVYTSTDVNSIQEELNNKSERFKELLPKLQNLKLDSSSISVELLTGKSGITMIFNEIVESEKEHYAFGDVSKFVENVGFDTQNFLNRLIKKKVSEKIIYPEGKKILKIPKGQYKILETKLIPPTPVIIFGNVTVIFLFANPVTIIRIDNAEIALSYMKYFNHYWSMGKKV